jgi:16S rRNA (cytosine1402-N4)-methyltransferase
MDQTAKEHWPVMVKEVIEALNIQANGIYLDATYGRGGHSQAILKQLGEKGQLWVMDQDPQAISHAKTLAKKEARLHIFHGNFSKIDHMLENNNLKGKIDGILIDLGVSSPQLDQAQRGFSFMHEGDLDMRFDPNIGQSAAQWLNAATEEDIADVLYYYGEERSSRRIAAAIIKARNLSSIQKTTELAQIIRDAIPHKAYARKHPATKSFLAIRLFINQELESLRDFLPKAEASLNSHGRLVTLSFHSLEDRLIKRFMQGPGRYGDEHHITPPVYNQQMKRLRLNKKPSRIEILANPRSRSTILRAAEKQG